MGKIAAITFRELYSVYTDRNLILIMIVTPLALATIIALALGGLFNASNDVPIRDIPVVVVNQDKGAEGLTTSFGSIFVQTLIPPAEMSPTDEPDNTLPPCPATEGDTSLGGGVSLFDLTDTIEMSDPDAARLAVENGEYVAAIIIPPDFSAKAVVTQAHPEIEPSSVEVYANSGEPISASIIRSIAEAITYQIATGNITQQAIFETAQERIQADPLFGAQFGRAAGSPLFAQVLGCAYNPGFNPLRIEQQTVRGEAATFNPFLYFGSSMAVFFMMFSAQSGVAGLLRERRQWTLQRLLVSPTPRAVILAGKLIGTFVTCVLQLTLLFIAFTVVSSLLKGQLDLIWGNDFIGIALIILASVFAASGLGALLNGAARTPEQASLLGAAVVTVMGLLGGTFFPVASIPALKPVTVFTINYWSVDAFTRLAYGQSDIGTHLLVLTLLGLVMFGIGLWLFNRQSDL